MADKIPCPICGAASNGGYHIGDSTVFKCPQCDGYRLAGTVITLFENGKLKKPDRKAFRALVQRKRGNSREYPVIIPADLGGETFPVGRRPAMLPARGPPTHPLTCAELST